MMESCMTATCQSASSSVPNSIFSQLLHVLLVSQCKLSSPEDYPADRTEEILSSKMEFDFIIVGAGTAGTILAHRLTEIENWNILLIEAGENPTSESDVPGLMLLLFGAFQDYAYKTEYQDGVCQGMTDKRCRWSKGKALGGSSVINAMLHVFGNDKDYNEWSNLGNVGWSYEEVLPYFTKSLNCPPEHITKWGRKHCGSGGPMNIRSYNYTMTNFQDIILEAVHELGLNILEPLNGDRFVGYGKAMGTIDKGRRVNAAKAFLSPIKNRKNLYVMKSSRVDKILFENTLATGVQVTLKNGRSFDLKASKEVIISAGSIASPKLLMLSGVGPKNHLEDMKIPVLADLSVGKNLQDHVVWIGMHITYTNESVTPPLSTYTMDIAYELLMHNTGELSTVGIDLLGFINVNDPNSKYPNIEIDFGHFPRWNKLKIATLFQAFNIEDTLIQEAKKMIMESDVIVPCAILLNPKSRGNIELRNIDPADSVKIYPNYLSEKEDLMTLMKSVEAIESLLKTESMQKYGMRLQYFDIPECQHTKPNSKEYWECSIRHIAGSLFHAAGTAKMGPRGDPTAVVDPKLRVHGVQRLRVIDASIMPNIVSGNINAPTMMIAEKGADLIKADWKKKLYEEL